MIQRDVARQLLAQARLARQAKDASTRAESLQEQVKAARRTEKMLLGNVHSGRMQRKERAIHEQRDNNVWDSLSSEMSRFDAAGKGLLDEV